MVGRYKKKLNNFVLIDVIHAFYLLNYNRQGLFIYFLSLHKNEERFAVILWLRDANHLVPYAQPADSG